MYLHLHTHACTYTIYIHTDIHLFKCISIFKYSYPKEAHKIAHNIWTHKYVDLYLYDQLQFDLLEKF